MNGYSQLKAPPPSKTLLPPPGKFTLLWTYWRRHLSHGPGFASPDLRRAAAALPLLPTTRRGPTAFPRALALSPRGLYLPFHHDSCNYGFAHLAANPLSNHKGGWQSQCPDPENLLAFRAPGRSKQATGCPVTPAVSEAASAEQGACHAARAKGPGATFSVEGK